MKLLEDRILSDGELKEGGIVKVDSFLNHQVDVALLEEIGKEFARLFKGKNITKIMTVEASGIGIAAIVARYFNYVPVVFAKKTQSKNLDEDVYCAPVMSFTHGKEYIVRVSKKYISPDDRILLIDDFLANGKALLGLIDIVNQAGATVEGAGICVEKVFQRGGKTIREMGIEVHSLAMIDLDSKGQMFFVQEP